MENNENLVTEQVTENVEQTTEQTPKLYTQEEVNSIVGKSKARTRAKIEKEYQQKYGDLETVLKAGTGKENVQEMTDTFRDFYQKKGITIPNKPNYSDRDIEVLARAEAAEIINAGFDEVVEEVERLSELGVANMTARDKAMFKTLAEYRQKTERSNELARIGVTEDVYNSPEFTDFAAQFNSNTPIGTIYDMYRKMNPQKEVKTMGSMKSSTPPDNGVKDFYSRDEALKFTEKDYAKNPALYEAVRKSMTKW